MDDHTEFDPCFKCSLFYQKSNAAKLVSANITLFLPGYVALKAKDRNSQIKRDLLDC